MNGLATYKGLHPFEFMSGSDYTTKKKKKKKKVKTSRERRIVEWEEIEQASLTDWEKEYYFPRKKKKKPTNKKQKTKKWESNYWDTIGGPFNRGL